MTHRTQIALIFILASSIFLLLDLKPDDKNIFREFQKFKISYKKSYSSQAEETYRKTIFLSNIYKIQIHNSDISQTHKLGINQFADLKSEQFIQIYLGTNIEPKQFSISYKNQNQNQHQNTKLQQAQPKADVDWTTRGNVSPIKNQGMCGSCWAFSTTGAIQSAYSIFKGQNPLLSEQQLIDCSNSYGNHGCTGGWMDYAYAYVKDHGLSNSGEYPYIGRNQTCQKDKGDYKISNYVYLPECGNLYSSIQQRPVSVAVDASTWALYRDGILSICGSNPNHGVLLVGANNNSWKIKNSWGINWGQNGYIRIARGNTCAVCSHPTYPEL